MIRTLPLAAILMLVSFHETSGAATLQPEAKAAWDDYLRQAKAAMQARLQPGAKFLWIDENPDRARIVRNQGVYIAPADPSIPQKVPSGLIHHWIGATFYPNVKIEDILQVVRNYDQFKVYYRPGVIGSNSHETENGTDSFTLRLANRSILSKTALDVDSEARYFKLDGHRWYGYSDSIHIRELDKFGKPEQRLLPEGEGSGLIWRLSSITRLEERDGGVYVELEALALSRDIPAAFRFFVMPVVRRVSRDSLATSLHQTKIALDQSVARHNVAAAAH